MAVDERLIQDLCERIVEEFHPVKVVLFGSHAYGAPHDDSDVDLLVILPFDGNAYRKSLEIHERISPDFPVDVLARSPDDAARRYAEYDPLIRDALDRGKVLYEREGNSWSAGAQDRRHHTDGWREMTGTAREWLDKAEGDYSSAGRELRARKGVNYDAACFHAQQCVEKLMKALMIHNGVVPPRTHDLVELSRLLAGIVTGWSWDEGELRDLTRGAVAGRYPGMTAGRDEARRAFDICTRLRTRLVPLLGGTV